MSAKDNTVSAGIVVSLYADTSSFKSIKTNEPLYFCKTDKNGYFQLQNIKKGSYRIYALKDQNFNYKYDQPNEMIGFIDRIVECNDSTVENIEIKIFEEPSKKLQLRASDNPEPDMSFSAITNHLNFEFKNADLSSGNLAYFSTKNDSIHYWYKNLA